MINSITSRLVAHVKRLNPRHLSTQVEYVQGQSPEPKIREYFYYIDHQGMVKLYNSPKTLIKARIYEVNQIHN